MKRHIKLDIMENIERLKDSIMRLEKNRFLFEELVKRDFKKKYKGTILGMGWSLLFPLLNLLVLYIVFSHFFGRGMEHYAIYLFCGNLLFNYFRESTTEGMHVLLGNAAIFTKINVPKYMFLLSRNISSLINFLLSLVIFFLFVVMDGISFQWNFLLLIYPIICLVVFNLGIGLIISALLVFYRDIGYLYNIFLMLLMYLSAIFYPVNILPDKFHQFFMLNPVFVYIKYFRMIVLEGVIPSFEYHVLCVFYALTALFLGGFIYKKYNHQFLYYT